MNILRDIIEVDKKLFVAINGLHCDVFDIIMELASSRFVWTPFYAWVLYLVYLKYGKHVWAVLLIVITMILFSDQTANVFKAMVQRPRPSHNPDFSAIIHLIKNYRGGLYGFFSSHAANAAALVSYLLLLLRPVSKKLLLIFVFYVTLTSYSRIYLGVHYPLDILAGIMCGVFLGFLFANFTRVVLNKFTKSDE